MKFPGSTSDCQSLTRPHLDEVGFKLRHHRKDIEEQTTDGISWIMDRSAKAQCHLAGSEFVRDVPRISQRPCQSIELGDDEYITGSARSERLDKSRAITIRASQSVIYIDTITIDAKGNEGVALRSEVLLFSGDPCVPDLQFVHRLIVCRMTPVCGN
jgi:hypothetical protein